MIRGLDVSHWDGTIEWPLLPDEFAFVFIKATEGGYKPDDLAWQHYIGAGQENIPRGCYHFWRFEVPAAKQAQEFVDRVRWLESEGGKMELPPVLDLEDTRAPRSTMILPHIRAVLAKVELDFGRVPIVYTARWWTEPYLGDCSWLRNYPLWLANYTYNIDSGPYYFPRGLSKWSFWQYSDKAEIPGIAENDECVDAFNGTLEELYALANYKPPLTDAQKLVRLWEHHPELHEE